VIDQGVAEGWLRHLGFIEETLLRQLYKGARLFIYPSTYEGFGLPALEAMASGAPVLVAGRSCLPEVCGNAAAYVDPDDHAGFTGKLAQALEDERWHTESRRLGRERAATFTWQRCIEGTVEVYREAWKLFGS
jgi:glycosyltransferase involved in cell wall biosynthesis